MNDSDPVKDYKVLKKKPKSEEAMAILKRISSQVKPILIKRSWKISNLCEFFPSNPNLLGLNMNRGWKINIRLRPHFDETQFLEYEDILGTLLHEMAHIVRGPHDAQFYKLLDELKEETEVLMASGYKGEGFYSDGHQLGTRSVPAYQSAQAAAAAAEKRLKLSKIMLPTGGVKLGGGSTKNRNLSPAQQAALAAEKRRQDQIWCGGSIIDTTTPTTSTKRKSSLTHDSIPVNTKKNRIIILDDDDEHGWACSSCTFLNKPITLMCEVCLIQRYPDEIPPEEGSWTCPQCTLVNDKKWQACTACTFVYLK